MRVFIVIDETSFYHPGFLAKFLSMSKDQVVGVALVVKVPEKNNIELYIRKHWYYLKFRELLELGYRKYKAKLLDFLNTNNNNAFYSVRSVLKKYKIDYFEVCNDINQKQYLDKIRSKEVDVIISSNSLYFGKEILSIPSKCCINRHSALLPSYGGLWPVFQAFRSGEKYVGVSVHIMDKKIDAGSVLSYRKIEIGKGDSLADLYEECFDISAELVCDALDKIRSANYGSPEEQFSSSYFSFPTKSHWIEFRKMNGRFI